jgi:hypothetical protein
MVEYRKQFIRHYMANERRAHRWMQLIIKESEEMGKKEFIPKSSGYCYVLKESVEMV